jgi:hypothetical protein
MSEQKYMTSSNIVARLHANRRGARDPQLTNSPSDGRVPNPFEPTLPNRPEQQHLFRGGDREQIGRARQAAEALFTPQRNITEQPVPEPSEVPRSRKPRVLPILASAPIPQETADAPVSSERSAAPEIPIKKRARLRTLVKYGMSISQVADLYRMPVETIERMLRKA